MFNRVLLSINLLVVVSTFLAYLAPHIDPELTWIIAFFGLFYPILLVSNVLFILFWLLKKWQYSILSAACLTFGWSELSSFVAFNSRGVEQTDQQLSIMSYNISNGLFGYDQKKRDRLAKKTALIEFLKQYEDTDVFCMQEVRDYGLEIIRKSFPTHFIHSTGKGAVILSRYPFVKKGEIDFGTITNSCLWADINVGHDTVRVYSFHLQSNQISKDAEKFTSQKELDQKQAWYDIKGMLRKFRNRHLTRSRQAERMSAHAKKSRHPVILSGDLNDPPQSYTYHILSTLGKDAFCERGNGIGTTYAGKIPLLRIDYIFSDHFFSVVDFNINKKPFSDHYAVSTLLEWPVEKQEAH
jgi:endonuclease/exonuclease/phosphatase family metal-dependent hydrolase